MAIGFAALHAHKPGILTFLLCAYILSYEGYFVISGTITNDSKADEREMQSNPSYIFHKKQHDKTSKAYDRLRKRYDDPEDKMYENSWFKEKYVQPAWEKYQKATRELQENRSAQVMFGHDSLLKILYRIGLVLLSMILVHRLFSPIAAPQGWPSRLAPGPGSNNFV